MRDERPPTSAHNESVVSSTPRRVGSSPGRVFIANTKKRVWNRKREILYGDEASNGLEMVMLRRISKISRKLGDASGYYFWILERLHRNKTNGRTDQTSYKIAEAAKVLGIHERTIKRYNVALKQGGWADMSQTTFKDTQGKERRGYNRVTLHPVNDLIHDQGLRYTSGRVGIQGDKAVTLYSDKAVPTSGKKKRRNVTPHSELQRSVSSSPSNEGENTEAGVASQPAPALQPYQGGDDSSGFNDEPENTTDQPILVFIKDKLIPDLTELGFKSRKPDQIYSDMKECYGDQKEGYQTLMDFWLPIRHKLKTMSWLTDPSKAIKPKGCGWIFRENEKQGEPNIQTLVFSSEWGSPIVSRLYVPGDIKYCWMNGVQNPAQILHANNDSHTQYLVVNPKYIGTPDEDDRSYWVSWENIQDEMTASVSDDEEAVSEASPDVKKDESDVELDKMLDELRREVK